MATVRYTTLFGDDFALGNLVTKGNDLATKARSDSELVLRDRGTGNFITIEGEDLSYKKGVLTDGTITGVEFTDADGKAFVSFTDTHYKTSQLGAALKLADLDTFFFQLFNGKDDILGSRVDDYLIGAAGDDTLDGRGGEDWLWGRAGTDRETGGGGRDYFMFNETGELDIITDFDARGGGDRQDYIATNLDYVSITQKGDHTIIDFGDGNRMKLLDVDASLVTVDDFVPLYGEV